jgi:hypothetical protein
MKVLPAKLYRRNHEKYLTFALLCVSVNIYISYTKALYTAPSTILPPSGSLVFLSHPFYSFEIQGSALLLQPTGSALHYAAEAIPFPLPSPH